MSDFQMDTSQGADAAAGATNEQLETLLRIVMWELALRTTKETFEQRLAQLAKVREQMDEGLDSARQKREQRRFVASVLDDLARLPGVDERKTEPTTGLYL